MVKEGFTPNPRDPCLYVHEKLKLFCALCVFLGMELNFFREVGICTLSQKQYRNKLGTKFLQPNQIGFPPPPTTPIETNIQEKLRAAQLTVSQIFRACTEN